MMIVELSKSEHVWFSKFLNKFITLRKSHVLNGMKVSDKIMTKLDEIVSIEVVKGAEILIQLDEEEGMFLIGLLEDCMMCCPGCSVSSVKHRSSLISKLCKVIRITEGE